MPIVDYACLLLQAPKKRTSHHNEAERSRRGELTNSYRRLHDRLKKYEPEKNKVRNNWIFRHFGLPWKVMSLCND